MRGNSSYCLGRSLLGAVVVLACIASEAQVYELRTYTTNDGKLVALHARFRDHTIDLFAKHGMESIAYWTPTEAPDSDNTLIYLLKHESREAASASWQAFLADPDWQVVYKASESDGPILSRPPRSQFLTATDYSPEWPALSADEAAVYELRTYTANEGKLDALNARFRDQTNTYLTRHGMVPLGYWVPPDGRRAEDTLIYVLRHPSREAARENWREFGKDTDWRKARKASEANGSIVKGLPSFVFMEATDYSPMR